MSGFLLYIDRSRVQQGQADELKAAARELAEFVEANESRILSYGVYFNHDSTEMTVIHLHPDSASLGFHLEKAGPRFSRFAQLLELLTIDIYGEPSEAVMEQLRQKAKLLGSGRVEVHRLEAGFARQNPAIV